MPGSGYKEAAKEIASQGAKAEAPDAMLTKVLE